MPERQSVVARRTARQRAASKRNLIKARRARMSRKKKVLVGAAILGTGATGVYAVDRTRNVRLYHNTGVKAANSIVKNGFRAGEPRAGQSATYFAKGRNTTRHFGEATVKAKVRRKQFRKIAHVDHDEGGNAYFIHKSNLGAVHSIRHDRGRKTFNYVSVKKRKAVRKTSRAMKRPLARRRLRKAGIY